MATVLRSALFFTVAASAGCVVSQHPLSNEETSKIDRRLLGTWMYLEDDQPKGPMVVGRKKDTANTMIAAGLALRRDGTIKQERLTLYTLPGETNFVTIEDRKGPSGDGKTRYFIARYELDETSDADSLRCYLLDPEVIARAVESGNLRGDVDRFSTKDRDKSAPGVQLTDSSEAILRFLRKHGRQCFEEEPVWLFERVGD